MTHMKTITRFTRMLLLTLFLLSCDKSSHFVDGWAVLSNNEMNDTWRYDDENRYTIVHGDFNGDKVLDEAKLLKRSDNEVFGLFVFISQKDGSHKTFLLQVINDKNMIHAMGIKKVPTGTYKTLCGKGYRKCLDEEPAEISLKNDAIDYFKIESANSFFYWNSKSEKFDRIWISD